MIAQVRLFALARQLAGQERIALELPEGSTVAELAECLVAAVPELGPVASHLLFAVDAQYASPSTVIPPGADIACIPPVSGG